MKLEQFHSYELPETPGVYFFKHGSQILYIGRATSLKDRVRSYFSNDVIATRGPRIVDMVTKADSIEWKETNSVLEAILLEAYLIKKHDPHANSDGKDDKSFNHVVITKEDFPRVLLVRGRDLANRFPKKSIKYSFGPFPEGRLLFEALKIIRRIFPYRDAKCEPPKPGKTARPCFNRQIGLCPGVCTGEITKAEYAKQIRRLKLFFEGKTSLLERSVKVDMKKYADAMQFEKAAELKRVLAGLYHIQDVALIKDDGRGSGTSGKRFRVEGYDVAHLSGKHMTGVMTVVEGGVPVKSEYRIFNIRGFTTSNDPGALREVITRRLKHSEWSMPDLVVVDGNIVQQEVARSLFPSDVVVVAVVKDERHKAKAILGEGPYLEEHKTDILLANAEAHRFSIGHLRMRARRSLFK
jgi:excinuclease ABC subunit C